MAPRAGTAGSSCFRARLMGLSWVIVRRSSTLRGQGRFVLVSVRQQVRGKEPHQHRVIPLGDGGPPGGVDDVHLDGAWCCVRIADDGHSELVGPVVMGHVDRVEPDAGGAAVLAEISVSTVVESEYLTLEEAARLAGHASASTLRAAARSGRLKTVK